MSPSADLLANTLQLPHFHPRLPQQRRLYEAAKAAIHQQLLVASSKLPSSRDLARDLGMSRNTVIAAFEQLAAEGYVTGHAGSGTFVANWKERMIGAGAHAGAAASLASTAQSTLLSRSHTMPDTSTPGCGRIAGL